MSDKLFPILHSLVKSYIVEIRQHPVIVDADVAALYGVETKRVNEAVKNNPDKFPEDYMFVLTSDELKDLRSKISTTNLSAKSRSLPKAFTEKGLYMLATILKSQRAKRIRDRPLTQHIGNGYVKEYVFLRILLAAQKADEVSENMSKEQQDKILQFTLQDKHLRNSELADLLIQMGMAH